MPRIRFRNTHSTHHTHTITHTTKRKLINIDFITNAYTFHGYRAGHPKLMSTVEGTEGTLAIGELGNWETVYRVRIIHTP